MNEQSVVGIYKSMDEAEKAVHALDQAKLPVNQVSTRDQCWERKSPDLCSPGSGPPRATAGVGLHMKGVGDEGSS